jgi:hypothetical protein
VALGVGFLMGNPALRGAAGGVGLNAANWLAGGNSCIEKTVDDAALGSVFGPLVRGIGARGPGGGWNFNPFFSPRAKFI